MTSTIPPTGYLTFADLFMIISYATLLGGLATSVTLMNLIAAQGDESDADKKERLNRITQRLRKVSLVSLPAAWLVAQGIIVRALVAGSFTAPH